MEKCSNQRKTYLAVKDIYQFTNNTAFSILQATEQEYPKQNISVARVCGRTLFDLQETTCKDQVGHQITWKE